MLVLLDPVYSTAMDKDFFIILDTCLDKKTLKKYQMKGQEVLIEFFPIDQISTDIFNWAFELTKTNMQELYFFHSSVSSCIYFL